MKKDIEEMIAVARAEEEVRQEMEPKRDFKEELKARLSDAIKDADKNRVTIDLEEYMALKYKERDLDILLNAIFSSLQLGYRREDLAIKDDDLIVNATRVIYPEAFRTILEELKDKENED